MPTMPCRCATCWWTQAAATSGSAEASDRLHLEVVLGDPAVRAGPVLGHVFPARARGNAFLGHARGLVIDESAHDAHPGAEGGLRSGGVHRIMDLMRRGKRHSPTACRAREPET